MKWCARRGTNTPASAITWYLKTNLQHWPSRYTTKSLDYEHGHILNEVNHGVTLVHIHPSNSLQDIKQNPNCEKIGLVFLSPILWNYLCLYFFHYIWENIHEIGKNKAIFGLGMPPVTRSKTDQIKSMRLLTYIYFRSSIYVSHWSIIPNMTFLHHIVFKIPAYIYFMRYTHLRIFNVKLCGKFHERDGRTYKRKDGRTERRKLYTPLHKCRV